MMARSQAVENFDLSWIHKEMRCWVYLPNNGEADIFYRGVVKNIVPLSLNKGNSSIMGLLDNGTEFKTKASLLEKIRESNSMERDLIEMDTINGPEVLLMLKRRLLDRKIHTCLWDSLIIVNPFRLIPEQYSEKMLLHYFEHIFLRKEDLRKYEPHIYSFTFQVLNGVRESPKAQVVCISGQSGSGKTETNKQALKAISFGCSRCQIGDSRLLRRQDEQDLRARYLRCDDQILQCDPILESFGNAKTIKNDNSSRFGKLITLQLDNARMSITSSSIKNFFLEKSRIISQANGQRNFHVFYQLLKFMSDQQRTLYRLRSRQGVLFRADDFNYITQKSAYEKQLQTMDQQMWKMLKDALLKLEFAKESLHQIWSIVAAVLLLGNIEFDGSMRNENDPCEVKQLELVESVSELMGIPKKELAEGMVFHRKVIAGETMLIPLTVKQCVQGRDSMAKSMYEGLFQWIVEELNRKLNFRSEGASSRQIKLLDIYGFQVFESNSFEQLCVNYTNEKIHQIYLEQVFISEKDTLKREGLEPNISKMNFTDNVKIIELLELHNKSIFNLLDQSCTLAVQDDDFLTSVRRNNEGHEHFPNSNSANVRKSFIVRHTPGDIEYMAEGFRDKNKDLLREDIVSKLCGSQLKILSTVFKERVEWMKSDQTKKFLGLKIRRQVKELMQEMSTESKLHFIRCIKPNERKEAFLFVERVCYNQIRYLGILDTVQMRKESYHIRTLYSAFYRKYGILEDRLDRLIRLDRGELTDADIKRMVMDMTTQRFAKLSLEYLFGRQRIFLKMSSQNYLDVLLKKKVTRIEHSSSLIKVAYRCAVIRCERARLLTNTVKIQRVVALFLKRLSVMRRNRAALKISRAWIKNCEEYFLRKKRSPMMVFQKYALKVAADKAMSNKVETIRRAKALMRSLIKTNKVHGSYLLFQQWKRQVSGSIYTTIWTKMQKYYGNNLIKYMLAFAVRNNNSRQVQTAEQSCEYRLTIKYHISITKYLKAFAELERFGRKLCAVRQLQSWFRMIKRRRLFVNLRNKAVRIQRAWRSYQRDKNWSMKFTSHWFSGEGSALEKEQVHWRNLLHRALHDKIISAQEGVEGVLSRNEKVLQDKIGLFYYLLDFQILCDLSTIYPKQSWIRNYVSLFEQSWERGNPIQYVDVSDEHTVCATINRVYSWGVVDFSLEKDVDSSTFTPRRDGVETIPLPNGSNLEQVIAGAQFTAVQLYDLDEPVVVGNRKSFDEDSSKGWKTLSNLYVIVNGIILTHAGAALVKLPFTETVAQLSCGMNHCVAKTSLRKVFTWGDNQCGQLGHGHFRRMDKPKLVEFVPKNILTINQVAASAFGTLMLDLNGKVWWWGTNGTIKLRSSPCECLLFEKSEFLDNPQKYSVVRLIPKWSRSLSLIGVMIGSHQKIFKTSQNSIRKKTYQNLMGKWCQNPRSVNPPFVQAISGYFQEKHMPKIRAKAQDKKAKQRVNERIREKLLAQILLMEQTERDLLKIKNKANE